jgi:hypothetical protein
MVGYTEGRTKSNWQNKWQNLEVEGKGPTWRQKKDMEGGSQRLHERLGLMMKLAMDRNW